MNYLVTALHYIIITEISRKGNFLISSPQTRNTKIFSLNPNLLILSYSNDPSDILSITLTCTESDSKSSSVLKKIIIEQTFDSFVEDGKKYQKVFKFKNPNENSSNDEYSELVLEFIHSDPHKYFKSGVKNKTSTDDLNEYNDVLIKNGKANLKFKDISIIGHRGFGSNEYTKEYLENSIPSFKAALNSGADFVECDVQLTKDDIPIVIHDNRINHTDISDYKLDEFLKLGLSVPYKGTYSTFKELLQALPNEAQLDVEIKVKWSGYYDRNHFVNRVLDVVYKYNNHKLFFCTFDPMIAAITALKQKSYNVFLLIHDPSSRLVTYYSPLFKYCGVKGFIFNSQKLVNHLEESKKIIANGFMLMTWGNSNLRRDTLAQQIDISIRGFITDDVPLTLSLINEITNSNNN